MELDGGKSHEGGRRCLRFGRQIQGSIVKAEPFKEQFDDKQLKSTSLSLSPLWFGNWNFQGFLGSVELIKVSLLGS